MVSRSLVFLSLFIFLFLFFHHKFDCCVRIQHHKLPRKLDSSGRNFGFPTINSPKIGCFFFPHNLLLRFLSKRKLMHAFCASSFHPLLRRFLFLISQPSLSSILYLSFSTKEANLLNFSTAFSITILPETDFSFSFCQP